MPDLEKKTKRNYEAPALIDLGKQARGFGACSPGSGDTDTCTAGVAALTACTEGNAASAACTAGGAVAT